MGFVDKWPSRMQGQQFFQNQAGGQQFSVRYKKSLFYGRVDAPAQIFRPQKVHEGELNVPPFHATTLTISHFECACNTIFWPSPVRIGPFPNFDVFHPVIGDWRLSKVDGEGDCH
jgi:hypothetical protein